MSEKRSENGNIAIKNYFPFHQTAEIENTSSKTAIMSLNIINLLYFYSFKNIYSISCLKFLVLR